MARLVFLTNSSRADCGPSVTVSDATAELLEGKSLAFALDLFKQTGEDWKASGWWYRCAKCGGHFLECQTSSYVTPDTQQRVCGWYCAREWKAAIDAAKYAQGKTPEFRGLDDAEADAKFHRDIEADQRKAAKRRTA